MIVRTLKERGFSERAACWAAGIGRSSFEYLGRRPTKGDELFKKGILKLAHRHPRYGYRRITHLLRRDRRWTINPKRVYRIIKEGGLCVPRKRPRRRRRGDSAELPHRARYRNHVWTYDFAYDRTQAKRTLKILVVVDEWTRECHRIRIRWSMDAEQVIEALEWLFEQHGAPEFLRSDNGGEFVAQRVQEWIARKGARTIYITPGHPWENPYAESFIGKLRDECLNEEEFRDEREAQMITEEWRIQYNTFRPHSALGYRTPAEVARCSVKLASNSKSGKSRRGEKKRGA